MATNHSLKDSDCILGKPSFYILGGEADILEIFKAYLEKATAQLMCSSRRADEIS